MAAGGGGDAKHDIPKQPSVKRIREAMRLGLEECEEKTTKVEQALQKAETAERSLERLARRSTADHTELEERLRSGASKSAIFADTSILDSTTLVAAASEGVARLTESLRVASGRLDDAERRTSYGLYERWRRRIDLHLCAGGTIEQSNTMEFLDASRGYKPLEELVQLKQEEQLARKRHIAVGEELDSARSCVRSLKTEVGNAENQRAQLSTEVEMQKRNYNEWWQWHKSQLPGYCELLDTIRGTETSLANLRAHVEQGRIECVDLFRSEAAADADLQNARLEYEAHEQHVRKVQGYEQATAHHTRDLEQQAEWQPDEVNRFQRVRQTGRQLEQVRQFHEMCSLESEEARKTEARCATEKENFSFRFLRAQEELLTVQRHIELLRTQRKATVRLLMERTEARQELLQEHAEVTLEHERQKVALAAHGIVSDLGHGSGRGRGRSFSPQPHPETYVSFPAGMVDSSVRVEARSFSPMPRRRAL